MDIIVYGNKLKVTEAINSHVNLKADKLNKFKSICTSINIILEVQHNQFIAKVTAKIPHSSDIHAESTTQDMYNSIDNVIEKIENQLRKIKDISTNKQPKYIPNETDSDEE